MTSFTPSPDHAGEFRQALGQFATGVTVVTAPSEVGPIAMTVNSFTSVSLDPPLILWCPAHVSERHDGFISAPHFAIHVLKEDQMDLARHFASCGEDFSPVNLINGAHDVPLFDDCLARFECKTHAVHSGGDHSIMVGEVLRVTLAPGAPLAFQAGHFGRFTPIS
ncbi:flavin reductase family protein [Aliiroseovarius sp. F20344]|uniref:flavin reductase family protein n=1 Tax=Aliiroseovarius sp. F20344 TaxID=2926414 RepID=UPI001FF173D7|nr:flavin reductase family protein [Aliiroseovarius sp. F20344]MCK0143797.1 flavin reductase family protein [Aliiroseovarius sp. F20344]